MEKSSTTCKKAGDRESHFFFSILILQILVTIGTGWEAKLYGVGIFLVLYMLYRVTYLSDRFISHG